MPPKVKITKEMIENASFEVIRERGHENLSARTIAEYLKCSTQPVLYSFRTVDEIREAALCAVRSGRKESVPFPFPDG